MGAATMKKDVVNGAVTINNAATNKNRAPAVMDIHNG